jgi:hypothetical protein
VPRRRGGLRRFHGATSPAPSPLAPARPRRTGPDGSGRRADSPRHRARRRRRDRSGAAACPVRIFRDQVAPAADRPRAGAHRLPDFNLRLARWPGRRHPVVTSSCRRLGLRRGRLGDGARRLPRPGGLPVRGRVYQEAAYGRVRRPSAARRPARLRPATARQGPARTRWWAFCRAAGRRIRCHPPPWRRQIVRCAPRARSSCRWRPPPADRAAGTLDTTRSPSTCCPASPPGWPPPTCFSSPRDRHARGRHADTDGRPQPAVILHSGPASSAASRDQPAEHPGWPPGAGADPARRDAGAAAEAAVSQPRASPPDSPSGRRCARSGARR